MPAHSRSEQGEKERGAAAIVLFTGIMNATHYTDILDASLVPFIREYYPHHHHRTTIRNTQAGGHRVILLQIGSIGGEPSPDLNPIGITLSFSVGGPSDSSWSHSLVFTTHMMENADPFCLQRRTLHIRCCLLTKRGFWLPSECQYCHHKSCMTTRSD